MLKTTTCKLTRMGMIAFFVATGAVACSNNADYKDTTNDNNTPGADSGSRRISTATVPADSTAVGSGAAAAYPPSSAPASVKPASSAANTPPTGNTRNTKGKFTRGRTSISAPKIYSAAEVAPKFPGGQNGLDNYINNHVNYPQQALDNDVSGIVRISFVVDEQGNVTKAKVMDAPKGAEDLDKEALRVVNSMPGWTPGKVSGKSVKVRMELPISFQVES